ncbi:unnamed protein product [Gongylonema pulchrum]|uniref:PPM-type phosphatase domain-containing protein n=1 Tax=Gongylonema pulchrum TaxID=637853 RepID=A0A183EVT4_9BILA|nr:unnamed protein product [Gongylonema pulchrum]
MRDLPTNASELAVREFPESTFRSGRFFGFVDGHGEIVCSTSGFRYIFGPEAIDLGPCCDPCDENWQRILKHGDILMFHEGFEFVSENGLTRTARRVIIPESCDVCSNFLGVVLREYHPSSRKRLTAAFFCPPFGILTLHKHAFGYNSDNIWPPRVGARYWVKLEEVSLSSIALF